MKELLFGCFLVLVAFSSLTQAQIRTKNPAAIIQGQLLKSTGRPLPNTEIELIPAGAERIVIHEGLNSISNATGRFTFSNVPTGRYTLAINFRENPTDLSPYDTHFYPDSPEREKALIFEVVPATKITGLVFKLRPPLTAKMVTGRVVNDFGFPVPGAVLGLWDLKLGERLDYGSIRSSSDGKFSILGFVGRTYQLGAVQFDRIPMTPYEPIGNLIGAGETPIFTLEPTTKPIELRIRLSDDARTVFQRYIAVMSRPTLRLTSE